MKKIIWGTLIATGALAILCGPVEAQSRTPLEGSVVITEPFQQNVAARYRLFPTQNRWTFIELDTATGRLWQVQYSISNDNGRFVINSKPLADNGRAGRFTLYQTSNIWNFILLDQEDGRAWQAQFSVSDDNAGIFPILDRNDSDDGFSIFLESVKKRVPDADSMRKHKDWNSFLLRDSGDGETHSEKFIRAALERDVETTVRLHQKFQKEHMK